MKKISKVFLLLFGVTLAFTSCKKVPVASTIPTETQIILPTGFLGLHGKFHNGQKSIVYVISVDSYKGNGQFEANFRTDRFVRTNDDLNSENVTFKTKVPKSGTFVVSITAQSEGCMKFANGASCPGNYGRVFYRGITPKYDGGNAPRSMFITPLLANEF